MTQIQLKQGSSNQVEAEIYTLLDNETCTTKKTTVFILSSQAQPIHEKKYT